MVLFPQALNQIAVSRVGSADEATEAASRAGPMHRDRGPRARACGRRERVRHDALPAECPAAGPPGRGRGDHRGGAARSPRRTRGGDRQDGPFRAVGSAGYDRAATLVEDELRAAGWTVTADAYAGLAFLDEGGSSLEVGGADVPGAGGAAPRLRAGRRGRGPGRRGGLGPRCHGPRAGLRRHPLRRSPRRTPSSWSGRATACAATRSSPPSRRGRRRSWPSIPWHRAASRTGQRSSTPVRWRSRPRASPARPPMPCSRPRAAGEHGPARDPGADDVGPDPLGGRGARGQRPGRRSSCSAPTSTRCSTGPASTTTGRASQRCSRSRRALAWNPPPGDGPAGLLERRGARASTARTAT